MRYTAALILAATTLINASAQSRYVSTRIIVLEYGTTNGVEVSHIDLWVTTDNGRTWSSVDAPNQTPNALRYTANHDGRFGFSIILHNDAGPSGPAPEPGTTPAVTIVVDTVPPLLQVHDAQARRDDDNNLTITVTTSLIEEDLSDTGIHVFYRTLNGDWTDGGSVQPCADTITWSSPPTLETMIDIRIVATDRAGNHATSEITTIELPAVSPAVAPTYAPNELDPGDNSIDAFAPVLPPIVAPVQPLTFEPSVKENDAPQSPADDDSRLQHLRDLAQRFTSEGRYSLAAARYQDAAHLAPADADTLVDLGSAHYRLGRLDQAHDTFNSATNLIPDHIGAIEGLALVAATQKRYPQAREHLQHLLRLQPQSGITWLRYGDVEHRLGNTTPALEAWRKALAADDADANTDLRHKAQRRLDYFGNKQPIISSLPAKDRQEWQNKHQLPRSSSSSATKKIANP